MATQDEVLEIVIEPMAAMFGRPFGCKTDEEAVTAQAQYLEALQRFPADALRDGWADVRVSWRKSQWPPLAEIAKAARQNWTSAEKAPERAGIGYGTAVSWLWKTDNGRLAVERDVCEPFVDEALRLQAVPPRFSVQAMEYQPYAIADSEIEEWERGTPLWRMVARHARAVKGTNARLRQKAQQHMAEAA